MIANCDALSKSGPCITFIVLGFKMLKTIFFFFILLVGIGPLKRQGLRTRLGYFFG